jgi:RNA polymerase sigma-70 factor (ECF subfamily)
MLERLGRRDEARVAFEAALALAPSDAERRFLTRRIGQVRP